ncbi:MAG: PKD domain-containing protein, partial [Chitinophagaceae bacterium]|nr:PKD domain-containing protein [Chitinophagaceae bacterium]
MNRIILFVSLLLLTFVNANAAKNPMEKPTALIADFTATTVSGCAPLLVQFNSTSSHNPGDPIVSYTWDFGDGTIITTTDASPSHTFSTPDPHKYFTVKLTVTAQSSATNTTTKTDFIKIYEKLVPNFGPDVSICQGTNYMLDPNLPYNADTYVWNNPAWNDFGGYPFVNISDAGEYWVEVTHGTCSASDTIVVSAIPPVFADFDYTVLNTCGQMDVQFNDRSGGCSGNPLDYYWYIFDEDYNNSWDYYTANPTHTFTSEGIYYVYLYVDDGVNPWPDPQIVTINVTFTSGPSDPDLGPDKNICVGGSVQLDAGYEPGATYTWTPATGLSSTSVYNPVASPSSTTSYVVYKTKCGINSNTDTIIVNVNTPPTVNLGPDATVCAGSSITLDAGNAGATYLWSTGATTRTITINPSSTTTYSVDVTLNGCTASDTITVNVNPSFTVDLGPDQSMCAGGSITLDAGVTGATYQWGSTFSPAYSSMTTKTVIALGAGKYWVTVTKGGCSVTDTVEITVKPAVTPSFGYV